MSHPHERKPGWAWRKGDRLIDPRQRKSPQPKKGGKFPSMEGDRGVRRICHRCFIPAPWGEKHCPSCGEECIL